jgi:hypothetical protein
MHGHHDTASRPPEGLCCHLAAVEPHPPLHPERGQHKAGAAVPEMIGLDRQCADARRTTTRFVQNQAAKSQAHHAGASKKLVT